MLHTVAPYIDWLIDWIGDDGDDDDIWVNKYCNFYVDL